MDKWTILTYAVVSGLGTLVFLQIVARELVFRTHVLKLRVDAEREQKAKAAKEAAERRQAEAADPVVEARPARAKASAA